MRLQPSLYSLYISGPLIFVGEGGLATCCGIFGYYLAVLKRPLQRAFLWLFPIGTIDKKLWLLYPLKGMADVRGGIVSALKLELCLFTFKH